MPDSFFDHRGSIIDLLGPVDAVTEIVSKAGAVRGNHVHARTTQWTYVCSGRLLTAVQAGDGGPPILTERGPGDLIEEPAGLAHAWKALTGCTVLVFTRGPRSGAAYESDTERLAVPLL